MRVFPILVSTFVLLAAGCDDVKKKGPPNERQAEIAEARQARLQNACASTIAYERLKDLVFNQTIRIRNADPVNLNTLATHSMVRMENPLVVSRDDSLGIAVCSGRFILELPPGAERAFNGQRRLVADVEYTAQAAADGSGFVYRIRGAEPIIEKLTAFDLKSVPPTRPSLPKEVLDAVEPDPNQPPIATPPSPDARTAAKANPSFDCADARTRSERTICADPNLAALDRRMDTQYGTAIYDADPGTRTELRRTRDRFLAWREACTSRACIADAYRGRMQEIRDIVARGQ
jgi:uncharacterized protein YecT (DUF1311 family)